MRGASGRLLVGVALLGGLGLAWPRLASAQGAAPGTVEAELPDLDAIEKGARPPASQSFRPKPRETKRLGQDRAADAQEATKDLEGAAMGLAPPGGLYGVEGEAQQPGEEGDQKHAIAAPELHVVKKGDTLWSLCDFYFRDPWRWPKLWATNPLITNPHWIFPGDVVRLRGSDGTGGPGPAGVASGPVPGGTGLSRTGQGTLPGNALVLRAIGYVEAHELTVSAQISGSREEKIMLATGDQAYLAYRKDRPVRAGARYTVFVADTQHPVRSPDSGEILGYLVRIYGDIVVDQIADGTTARGTLTDVIDPIERGYYVSPQVKQFKRIEPRPSAVNLELRVVASFSAARMLAAESFVVLSRGRKDGIEVGNRSFVVRRGDGYRGVLENWDKFDPRFPREVVGEIWVVEVRDTTSLAWVARTNKEIRVGEIAEMRKGH